MDWQLVLWMIWLWPDDGLKGRCYLKNCWCWCGIFVWGSAIYFKETSHVFENHSLIPVKGYLHLKLLCHTCIEGWPKPSQVPKPSHLLTSWANFFFCGSTIYSSFLRRELWHATPWKKLECCCPEFLNNLHLIGKNWLFSSIVAINKQVATYFTRSTESL